MNGNGGSMEKTKLVVVVGPTASGKTKLAVELAKKNSGEVISADSMQVYREMSIATAKPTVEEMDGVPHHLVDFLPLSEEFSVSDFVTLARARIAEIAARGNLPIVAGGTGLYINSLIDHVNFSEIEHDGALRERLYAEAKLDGGKRLYDYLCQIDPESAAWIHPNNLVRVVRAVEIYEATGLTMTEQKRRSRLEESPYDVCIIGLNYRERQTLYDRINRRVDLMVEAGLLDEVRRVYESGNLKTAYNAIGYKELVPYLQGEAELGDCLEKVKQESRRYAKRQLTWFRRDGRIHWIYPDEETDFCSVIKKSQKYVETFTNI